MQKHLRFWIVSLCVVLLISLAACAQRGGGEADDINAEQLRQTITVLESTATAEAATTATAEAEMGGETTEGEPTEGETMEQPAPEATPTGE
jgi:hypothetical protein